MVPLDLVRKTANRRLRWLPTAADGSRFGKIGGVGGPMVFNVILWFVRGLSTKFMLSVSYAYLYGFLNINTSMSYQKGVQ